MLKTSQFQTACKDDSGYFAQLKQQKCCVLGWMDERFVAKNIFLITNNF